MKPHRFLVVGLAALALAGCASAPGPNCVRLAYDGWFCLLAPAALPAQEGTALVTVTRAGESQHYVGRLSISTSQLQLVLLTLAGVPAATLRWNGIEATLIAPPQAKLDARRLVAMLELTVATPATLRPALHGLTLSSSETAAGKTRQLMDGADLVARAVTEASGVTRIEVPRLRLELTLKPVQTDGDE